MTTAIRKHIGDFAALLGIFILAIGIAGYVLSQQESRPTFPIIEETPFKLKAEFSDAQAVVPGQGQAIVVAGVTVGKIRKVDLKEGRAIVTFEIEKKYAERNGKKLIHRNATVLLRPRTGLKDMLAEMDPGFDTNPNDNDDETVNDGDTLPVQNTAPDIDPDEILAALDTDTRAYLQLLLNGAGKGLRGSLPDAQQSAGVDLRLVFELFEPLHQNIERVNGAFAKRRRNLARLVHNYGQLTSRLGREDEEIARLVTASNAVFEAFASEDQNVSLSVARLPSALEQTETTLRKVDTFSDVLGPALDDLRPPFRQLDTTNREVIPFMREAEPILRKEIRPFVRVARPYVSRELRPAARGLRRAIPDLEQSFHQLNRLFNALSYNKGGAEPLSNDNQRNLDRDEGYLFWLAWVAQNGNSLFSTADSGGPFRRAIFAVTCTTIRETVAEQPGATTILGVADLLATETLCPTSADQPIPDLDDLLPFDLLNDILPRDQQKKDKDGSKKQPSDKRDGSDGTTVPEAPNGGGSGGGGGRNAAPNGESGGKPSGGGAPSGGGGSSSQDGGPLQDLLNLGGLNE